METYLGVNIDGAVRRLHTDYDGQGNASLLTSYDAASGGSIVNQVKREYNGLGQLTSDWQSHSGAVSGSSPRVQYAYSEMSGGANHSRLTSMTYPNGYVLTSNYSSGLNSNVSRLSSLSDSGGTLESYDYLGYGTVVKRAHSQLGVDLTYIGTGTGSAGDQYVGLDAFGRVIDHNWKTSSSSTDRFTYTYDRNGNRLTKGNSVNSSFDENYSYDNLNQISSFSRSSHSQSWDYDALGNWDSVTTDNTTQTRSHNKQNEITSVSGASSPTFDSNGNMLTDETGKQFVFDAWNRLKIVKDSSGNTLKTYTYDALTHRISETAGSNTTDLYYSAGWQVLEERVNGSGKYRYVWSPVYVDAMILRDRLDASERLWVQQDANFNVTALVDNSGSVVERFVYDPFGKASVLDASWSTLSSSGYAWVYLHQGGRLDETSGLYHFRNRDYSPTLGRWTSMDPIQYKSLSVNLYTYEHNNAIARLDYNGLRAPKSTVTINGISVSCTGCDLEVIFPLPPGLGVGQKDVKSCSMWTPSARCCSLIQANIADTCCKKAGKKLDTCSQWLAGGKGFYYSCRDQTDRERCDIQYSQDSEICRSLRNETARKKCWASAMERYSQCINGGFIPPLVTK